MLLEFAGQYVRVHVEDCLTGTRAGVEDQAELATGEIIRKLLGDRDHFRKRLGFARCKLNDVAILS